MNSIDQRTKEVGGKRGKKEERRKTQREKRKKKMITGFLDLNTYFHGNTNTYLILICF